MCLVSAVMLSLVISVLPGQAQTGTLKGKVENEKGKPISGVEVRVMNSRNRSIKETRTDEEGAYKFEVEPGDYTVSFDAEGYQGGTLVAMQQVEEAKETEVNTIRLQKAKRTSLVRGVVFDTRGFGIAGAKVKLERIPTEDEERERKKIGSLTRDYTTNSRGEFAFRLPPNRARYRLTAILSGFKSDSKVVEVAESEAVPVSLTLEPLKKD
jgi:hypothetical protein